MRHIYFISLVLLGVACGEIKPQKTSAYFAMDSLVDTQLAHLIQNKARLQKTAIADGDTAEVTFLPDSLAWANEMVILKDLNINKPALIGQYSITDEPDKTSNLRIKSYQAKNEELRVKQFDIYYLKKPENIKWVKIRSSDKNSIFSSSRYSTLEFEKSKQVWSLKSYTIQGYQKMILQDSVNYEIQGNILDSE